MNLSLRWFSHDTQPLPSVPSPREDSSKLCGISCGEFGNGLRGAPEMTIQPGRGQALDTGLERKRRDGALTALPDTNTVSQKMTTPRQRQGSWYHHWHCRERLRKRFSKTTPQTKLSRKGMEQHSLRFMLITKP